MVAEEATLYAFRGRTDGANDAVTLLRVSHCCNRNRGDLVSFYGCGGGGGGEKAKPFSPPLPRRLTCACPNCGAALRPVGLVF